MIPVFDFIRTWYDSSIEVIPVHTSGSTGIPKVITHERAAMMASATRTCDFFDLKEGDKALLALPATHIGGKMMILRALVRKLQLICVEPKSDPLAELNFEIKIDFAPFTPMQMITILDHPTSSEKLSYIKKVILGGGEVPYALRERLQHISPQVYETYGMTESISHIALKKINGDDDSEYFTTLDGVVIRQDDRGCLIISASYLSTDEIVTNDIVEIVDDKRFRWLGRYDNVINTGGIKVYPEAIERKLQPFIAEHFFITGVADDTLGQTVTLVVETTEGANAIQHKYADILSEHTDKYERPRRILRAEKFTYTETGKVNKKETVRNAGS